MKTTWKICILGLKCYDLLTGAAHPRYMGGIERQLVALGDALADRGHGVTFITYDHEGTSRKATNGAEIIPAFAPDGGLPGLRFVFPRISRIYSAVGQASADVLLQMGAGSETGASALASRYASSGRVPFIFLAASNADCQRSLPFISRSRERAFYRYGLNRADAAIVQTTSQRQSLSAELGKSSVIIQLPGGAVCDLGAKSDFQKPRTNSVLWVGRISEEKRLELLLDVADKLPRVDFTVVGDANSDSQYVVETKARMRCMANVNYYGKASTEEMGTLLSRNAILACTSKIEGFPTTFLEAWSFGRPVVTTFDPDDVIRENSLGFAVTDADEMVAFVANILNSSETQIEMGTRCKEYFLNNYSPDVIAEKIERVIQRSIDERG